MGANQSVHSTQEINDASRSYEKHPISTMNGQKTLTAKSEVPEDPVISTNEEDVNATASAGSVADFSDDDDFDDDDESEDGLIERRMILEDVRKLRHLAEYFYYPEWPVEVDGAACARCIFSRHSAPEQVSVKDEEERVLSQAVAMKLKDLAVDYLHPERPVGANLDGASFGRNYFDRPSAPGTGDEEEAEEQERIMEEMKQLKTIAEWYLLPEKPVVSDGVAFGRNYFSRPSAPQFDADFEKQERILADAKGLKTVAEWFFFPDKPVDVDATAPGRNYFTRASAHNYEGHDEMKERICVMNDMNHLKMTAEWFLQPGTPVAVNSVACGRNFFTRAAAPEYEEEMGEECDIVRTEAKDLKKVAEWYLQPHKPVEVDAAASGRNYFIRTSAPEYTDKDSDEDEELELILAEAKKLKTVAEWYLQPEKPVHSDGFATGRNYFTRASAPEYEEDETDAERDLILDDALKLKEVAGWYLHPDKPVATDSIATGRNFFSRLSAPEYYGDDDSYERERVLSDAKQLKIVAEWYLHPESPVVADCLVIGRNYFGRLSAQEYDDDERSEERDTVLMEANDLRKVADWYLHPDKSVVSDGLAMGRNYFSRPDSSQYDDEVTDEEREQVIFDASELKKLAEWYLHPERSLVTKDAFATGRNFFTRPSAPDGNENVEEGELVLAEAQELKKLAGWFLQREKPVVNTDAFSMGRNYFIRPSAPECDEALNEERDRILADAVELKKVAEWHLHPENPVLETDAFSKGRNIFNRPSAPELEDGETHEEYKRILVEANELKQSAEWYYNPEKPVTSNIAVTRHFFSRPSAEECLDVAEEEEKELILADARMLKNLAADYLHPEKPVESNINCIRNYFDRPSANGHSDHIHSSGQTIQELEWIAHHLNEDDSAPPDYHHQFHHYHYPADDDDHSYHTQSDHFEMDEDVFHGFRESLYAVQEHMVPIIKEDEMGEEGKLSRSPSTVMLFEEAM